MTPRTILIHNCEAVGLKKAAHIAGCSVDTVKRWAKAHNIYRQAGKHHPIEVSAPALLMVRHGAFDVLDLLRQDNREHEDVKRYFKLAGVPLISIE